MLFLSFERTIAINSQHTMPPLKDMAERKNGDKNAGT